MPKIIYEDDDSDAFGGHLCKVTLNNIEQVTITKAIFKCGPIELAYNNPTFPIYPDVTAEQTKQMNAANPCYLILYDANSKKRTLDLKQIIYKRKRV